MQNTQFSKILLASFFVLCAFFVKAAHATTQASVKSHAAQLFQSQSPVEGNPNADVNIVDFFDYQCGHCKELSSALHQLVKQDPHVRIIFKELPLFGDESEYAAKAALAAAKQGKYAALHDRLMKLSSLSESQVLESAKAAGLNMEQFKRDMNSKAIAREIQNNLSLSQALDITGLPVVIIAKNTKNLDTTKVHIEAGSMTDSELRDAVRQIRKG